MKKQFSAILALILLLTPSLGMATAYGASQLTTHEFLVYYLIRAADLGLDIGKNDIVSDMGSLISFHGMAMVSSTDNKLNAAMFMISNGKNDADNSLWLIAFLAAFMYPPSQDSIKLTMTPKSHYYQAAPDTLRAIMRATADNMYRMGDYGLYYDVYEGRASIIAKYLYTEQ